MNQSGMRRALSFEQDLLWSVLDQDAIPHILVMAADNWAIKAASAWSELQRQAALGQLRAYHGVEPSAYVELAQVSLEDAMQDLDLFVEPTEATRTRLRQIDAGAQV